MAEDQDSIDEEEIKFTPEGEALGYIGLDQAQGRAMQAAAETPGDYGSAYSGIRMAFEVAKAQETDDHYVITLSLRPQGDFLGRPGQEQFFIEKEGTVVHRQVLSLPRREGERRVPLVSAAVGLAVVAAIVVVVVFALGACLVLVATIKRVQTLSPAACRRQARPREAWRSRHWSRRPRRSW